MSDNSADSVKIIVGRIMSGGAIFSTNESIEKIVMGDDTKINCFTKGKFQRKTSSFNLKTSSILLSSLVLVKLEPFCLTLKKFKEMNLSPCEAILKGLSVEKLEKLKSQESVMNTKIGNKFYSLECQNKIPLKNEHEVIPIFSCDPCYNPDDEKPFDLPVRLKIRFRSIRST